MWDSTFLLIRSVWKCGQELIKCPSQEVYQSKQTLWEVDCSLESSTSDRLFWNGHPDGELQPSGHAVEAYWWTGSTSPPVVRPAYPWEAEMVTLHRTLGLVVFIALYAYILTTMETARCGLLRDVYWVCAGSVYLVPARRFYSVLELLPFMAKN